MRISVFQKLFILSVLLSLTTRTLAQDLWSNVQSLLKTTSQTSNQNNPAVVVQGGNLISWNSIPRYSAVKYVETDSLTGEVLKNEDGTVKYRMLLVDQFGNKRSAESVAAQQAKVKQAVKMILAKVTAGGLLGTFTEMIQGDKKDMLARALVGGTIGSGIGIVASADDIRQARVWKKVLKQQEKLLKAYRKNYNEEGEPKDGSVDPSKIKNLAFNEENTLSGSADAIKTEMKSAGFNTTDESVFDF